LKRKTVLVTGSSGDLGTAICLNLISRGFFVIGISRRKSLLNNDINQNNYFRSIEFDLSNLDGIPEMTKNIVRQYGAPYALVNNAAIGLDGILPTFHNSEIKQLVETNLLSPIILTKYVLRSMIDQEEGRIVNISSIVANRGFKGLSVYSATKAGLESFSRALAREVGPKRITVNCVAPGFIKTQMSKGLSVEQMASVEKRSALKRLANVSEVTNGIAFFLSDESSGITGTVLTVDAGGSV